jgi:hypothetical protein
VQIAAVKGVVSAIVKLSLATLQGAAWPEFGQIATAATLGFFGYGLSLVFFVLALRHLGTPRTGTYFSTAPFIGALLAMFLLGETLSVPFLLAAGLMGFGVYLHLTERHEHERARNCSTRLTAGLGDRPVSRVDVGGTLDRLKRRFASVAALAPTVLVVATVIIMPTYAATPEPLVLESKILLGLTTSPSTLRAIGCWSRNSATTASASLI